jgi:hypothetical protein
VPESICKQNEATLTLDTTDSKRQNELQQSYKRAITAVKLDPKLASFVGEGMCNTNVFGVDDLRGTVAMIAKQFGTGVPSDLLRQGDVTSFTFSVGSKDSKTGKITFRHMVVISNKTLSNAADAAVVLNHEFHHAQYDSKERMNSFMKPTYAQNESTIYGRSLEGLDTMSRKLLVSKNPEERRLGAEILKLKPREENYKQSYSPR